MNPFSNTFFSKILSYTKAHKIITAIIIVAVILETTAVASGAGKPVIPTYTLAAARTGTISQTVSGTGQVEGEEQLDVTPQGSGGQVISVSVVPGQMVAQGQVLATLDDQTEVSSLEQAKASLESAQANYDKVVEGLTPQQIAQDQASVTNATQSLATQLISSYTQTNNTLRTSIDSMFTTPTVDPSFTISFLDSTGNFVTFTATDPNLVAKINSERVQLNTIMPAWQADVNSLSLQASSTDLSSHVTLALNNLQFFSRFLTDLSNAVYGIAAQYTKYSSNVSSFKSSISSALQSIDSQISSVTSSNEGLVSAEADYNVNTEPPTDADVDSAQASLDNAQASLQSAQTAYADTRVTAPFAGQVGNVGVQVGDVASASTDIATISTIQKIADISLNEVDAATVHVGDSAMLTFSALPNVTVPAYVSEMSLVGTVSSGVVDYDVKLALATSTTSFASMFGSLGSGVGSTTRSFTASSTVLATLQQNFEQTLTEIKPGMSVTALITTESHPNVVVVAASAIKTAAGGRSSYVQELAGATAAGQVTSSATPKNITVTVGISNGTQTEITSGVAAGDLIITQTSNKSTTATAAAAATTRTTGGFGAGGFGGGGFGGAGGARAGGGAAAVGRAL